LAKDGHRDTLHNTPRQNTLVTRTQQPATKSHDPVHLPTITSAPTPSQIPNTPLVTTSLGADAVQHHAQDICIRHDVCTHSKLPQHNMVNIVKIFSHELVAGQQYSLCTSIVDNRYDCVLIPDEEYVQ